MKNAIFVWLFVLAAIPPLFSMQNGKITDSIVQLLQKHSTSDTIRVNLLNLLADSYKTTDINKYFHLAEEAGKIADKLNYVKGKAESLRKTGVFYLKTGKNKQAYPYLQKALNLFEKIHDNKGIGYSLDNLGIFYFEQNDYHKAIDYHIKSLRLAQELNDVILTTLEFNNIAVNYINLSDFPKALEYNFKGLKLAEKRRDSILMVFLLNNIAVNYTNLSNYPLALKYSYKCLEVSEKIGDKNGISLALINIASLHNEQGDLPKALEFNFKSLKLAEENEEKITVSSSLINIGEIYLRMDSIHKALEYSNKSLKLIQETDNKSLLGSNYLLLAKIYDKAQNCNMARQYFEKALSLFKQIQNYDQVATSFCLLAKHYKMQNDIPKAIENADSAFILAKKLSVPSIMLDASDVLHAGFAIQNNYKLAYHYFMIFKQMNDSIKNQENTRKLVAAEMQYKFDNELRQLEVEQAKKDLTKTKEMDRQRIMRNTLLGSLTLMLVLAFFIYRNYRIKRKDNILLAGQNAEIQKQQQEILHFNAQLQKQTNELFELDNTKTRFFTNISHEFRTPLTLIIGPVNALSEKTNDDVLKKEYSNILKQANKLLHLINQLLELSKIKRGSYELTLSYADIPVLLQKIVSSFTSLACNLEIELTCITEPDHVKGWIDVDKFEKMIVNLVSNAFKYTKKAGLIMISLECSVNDPNVVKIIVFDNGIGIDHAELKNIFEPFYQVENQANRNNEGSGIGLALVKELVELHGGKISVESKLQIGTTFTMELMINKEFLPAAKLTNDDIHLLFQQKLPEVTEPESSKAQDSHLKIKPVVLVVEDSEDLRIFIRDNLLKDYHVIEAENGSEGFEKAADVLPDLIIADIMMPAMNGIDMTKKIKTDKSTCHIPVIILTAKASDENRIEGLEAEANDYVVKPFNIMELKLRIKNTIQNRQKLREKFERCITVNPSEIVTTSLDEQFLQKALQIIENHMDDEELTAESFSKEIGYSRTWAYKKLMALTGQSVTEFIRSVRLKRAAQLILQSAGNTSEIAYQTGFTNLSYFSRCFKEQFGVNPSEYKQYSKESMVNI